MAPATAPRIGPHMRPHWIGGPACKIVPSGNVGMVSRANCTSTSTGSPLSSRRCASALAVVIFSLRLNSAISASEFGEQACDLWIADGRGRPIDVHDLDFAGGEVAREFAQANVDHAHFRRQQFVGFGFLLLRHALSSLYTGHNNAGSLATGIGRQENDNNRDLIDQSDFRNYWQSSERRIYCRRPLLASSPRGVIGTGELISWPVGCLKPT